MIKTQKVIKVGNNLAVTLDSKFVEQAGIKAGQEMAVSYKPELKLFSAAKSKGQLGVANGERLLKSESQAIVSAKITPELAAWTDKFLEENREAMKKLADL